MTKIFMYLTSILIVITLAYAYEVDPPKVVHQDITNESILVWKNIPFEIKIHARNPITRGIDGVYDNGIDDIITGSGEDDKGPEVFPFMRHFWQPDDPKSGNYNNGLLYFPSSYNRALDFWTKKVIPLYLAGQSNESYYYLGRVAHLLEDATQPSHIHLDPHLGHQLNGLICGGFNPDCDDSFLEEFTSNQNYFPDTKNKMNVEHYHGIDNKNQQYNYENLPNMQNFNWKEVQPVKPIDKLNLDLFRLFWYTSQKTQYFASDDVDGNSVYVNLSGAQKSFPVSLWQNDSVQIVSNRNLFNGEDFYYSQLNEGSTCTIIEDADFCAMNSLNFPCYLCNNNTGPNIEKETNAMIPHSMKAVSGLYRLFWDAVHIDWPTENHDFQRTGFTLLKGDLTNETISKQLDFFLDSANGSEQVIKPSIADIDGNGRMDTIIAVHKTTFNTFTKLYGTETKTTNYTQGRNVIFKEDTKMKFAPKTVEGGAIYSPPTLADLDGDGTKEIITGTRDGTVYVYYLNGNQLDERWKYHLEPRMSPLDATNEVFFNGGTAVDDIDLDGDKVTITTEKLINSFDILQKMEVGKNGF